MSDGDGNRVANAESGSAGRFSSARASASRRVGRLKTALDPGFTTADAAAAALFFAIAAADAWLVWSRIGDNVFPPNDSKHWLLRARYYLGWSVPTSELPGQLATHPLSMLLLALVVYLVGAPILAAKLWALCGFLGATAAVYVTARTLFSRRTALLSFAAVSFGQYLYFDMVTWGGIPNLLAVGLLTLAVGALARARLTETFASRAAFALLLLAGYFAHPPSAVVLVATIGTVAVALWLVTGRAAAIRRTLVDAAVPSALFLGYVAYFWRIFTEYTSSVDGQGALVVWQMLLRNPPMFVAFALAVGGLPVLFLRRGPSDSSTARVAGDADADFGGRDSASVDGVVQAGLLYGWLAGPILLAVAVDVFPWVSTELARVTYFLAAPFAVTVGVYLDAVAAILVERFDPELGRGIPGVTRRGVVALLLAVLVITPGFAASLVYFDNAQSYYAVQHADDVYDVVRWVDGQRPFEGRVAGPFSVAPWVKALTGQETLTPTPASGSYRPDEAAERDAYETIERVRIEGDTPANLAAARTVIDEYDVRYLIVPNNWRVNRYRSLGSVVYETDAYVVVDFGPPADREREPRTGRPSNAANGYVLR